jgi:hypothetical protein
MEYWSIGSLKLEAVGEGCSFGKMKTGHPVGCF